LLERDTFDLFLPEFNKPWVIHLRVTSCCSTNLCTWRPNTVYKNRSVRRHQALFWRRCRGRPILGDRSLCSGTLPGRGIAVEAISIDSTAIFIAVVVSYDEEGVVVPWG
jgi:hypothetical protein